MSKEQKGKLKLYAYQKCIRANPDGTNTTEANISFTENKDYALVQNRRPEFDIEYYDAPANKVED